MKIRCPSCEATYQLADGALGATGRKVRCTRCGTIWRAMPGMEDPIEPGPDEGDWSTTASGAASDEEVDRWRKALEEDDGSPAAAGTGFDAGAGAGTSVAADEPPAGDPAFDDPPADYPPAEAPASEANNVVPFRPAEGAVAETGATIDAEPKGFDPAARPRKARPKAAAKKTRKAPAFASASLVRVLVLTVAAGVVTGTLFGAVVAREQAVRLVPDLAGLYALAGIEVNLRGIGIRDVVTRRDVEGATPVLVVEGMLHNLSDTVRPVARIRFGLKSSTGREVYAWTMEAAKPSLDPGESLAFRSRLPAPPEAAETVEVRFADLPTP